MLAYKTHSQLVEATACMMRWYALATVNASAASASRGLALWTEWLEAAAARQSSVAHAGRSASMWGLGAGAPWWAQAPAWTAWGRVPLPDWNGWITQTRPPMRADAGPSAATLEPAAGSGVAAYRTAGGHAVAQVIMGKANGPAGGKSPAPATR
jgi:hypothetical protein